MHIFCHPPLFFNSPLSFSSFSLLFFKCPLWGRAKRRGQGDVRRQRGGGARGGYCGACNNTLSIQLPIAPFYSLRSLIPRLPVRLLAENWGLQIFRPSGAKKTTLTHKNHFKTLSTLGGKSRRERGSGL